MEILELEDGDDKEKVELQKFMGDIGHGNFK